jgi:AcrR family transcriptional regulator
MEQSADSIREVRRRETSRRISHCARVLTDDHGIDGFTMADLAAAAEVSRRTLFNYFPGKDNAVLGERPPPNEALLATFKQGGPTGDLVDDLVALVVAVLDTADFDRDEVALLHRVMHDNPRLIAVTKDHFESSGEMIRAAIEEREGAGYDDTRARVLFRVIASLVEVSLHHYLEHPDENLTDLFKKAIGALRSAFE